ncbi:hypothetical protein QUB05_25640 [Microcoleus sp. F10-C6]|uniref:hypothetical protein n=1 Tax=unclassified Microcoleus TaxID=2642155 RepID=UPI002FD56F8F
MSNGAEMLHYDRSPSYGRVLLPTPQENALVVEKTSCLFLRMVQDVISIQNGKLTAINYQMLFDALGAFVITKSLRLDNRKLTYFSSLHGAITGIIAFG